MLKTSLNLPQEKTGVLLRMSKAEGWASGTGLAGEENNWKSKELLILPLIPLASFQHAQVVRQGVSGTYEEMSPNS